MGRTCSVCNSIHKAEYERMRFEEGKNIKEIWIYARSKYNEQFSYHSMQRHLLHAKQYVQASIEVNKLRKKVIEESMKKDIEIVTRIERNLGICDRVINESTTSIKENEVLTEEIIKVLFQGLTETRHIIELLLKWQKQINLQPKESDIEDRIMYSIQDFPLELKKKFLDRWESYGNTTRS